MKTTTLFLAWLSGAVAAAASGDPATVAVPAQFKSAEPAAETAAAWSSPSQVGPWWTIFNDDTLAGLESQAVAANQDLRQSVARVMDARAQAEAARSGLFPNVSADPQVTRERTTNTGAPESSQILGSGFLPPGSPTSFLAQPLANNYNDFQAPLAVGYEIDVFGRIRHAYAQAQATAEASDADRRAVTLSLTAQVANNYFALRSVDSAVAVLTRTVQMRTAAAQIQRQRVKAGSASDVDVLRAQVEQANAEADLADVGQERAELENALAVLCGQSASDFHLSPRPLDQTPPPTVPAAVPAQLLSQRPDLIEADRRVAAAGEGTKAARAQFFPAIDVKADYGFESAGTGQLLQNQSRAWSITGGISIPIFDGGRNTAELKAARARTEEALGDYQQTLLTALGEVENALSNLRQRARQADARHRATEDAQKVYEATQRSYREGAITYFEVIDAQRMLLSAELAQVRTLDARYGATVDLIRATGGGYGGEASGR